MKRTHRAVFTSRRAVHSCHCDGINPPGPPDPSPQPCHPQALPVKVAGGNVVKHRVQACVEDDECHRDPPGVVDGVGSGAALDDVHAAKEVEQIDDMVGQEAEQRYRQDGADDPHSFSGHFCLYLGNSPCSHRVTHQDDQGGQQGAEGQADEAVSRQARAPLVLGEVLKASVASWFVFVCLQRSHEDEDQYSHSNCNPEQRTYDEGAPGAAHPQIGVRVYGGHVAVHTDTSHETDAHVDVGEEEDPSDTAGNVPKYPVVCVEVVVDLKG